MEKPGIQACSKQKYRKELNRKKENEQEKTDQTIETKSV